MEDKVGEEIREEEKREGRDSHFFLFIYNLKLFCQTGSKNGFYFMG